MNELVKPDQRGDHTGGHRLQSFHMWNDIRDDGQTRRTWRGSSALRIRRLRTARGWSMSSLAARAHLGKATLSEIESGQRNPTLETLYAIAAQLQIGLSELLTEAVERPRRRRSCADARSRRRWSPPTATRR